MTPEEMAIAVADVVEDHVRLLLAPVLERLAVAEARVTMQGDVRDRLVAVETKSAMPVPTPLVQTVADTVDLSPLLERVAAVEARIGDLRERVAVVEVRPVPPGPPGEPGPPGKDGLHGKDGTAGLSFEGVYQEGKSYDVGHLVTWAGSSWHCNAPTTTKPGDGSKDWTLMVKRGRDGKDGLNAPSLPVVSVGRS